MAQQDYLTVTESQRSPSIQSVSRYLDKFRVVANRLAPPDPVVIVHEIVFFPFARAIIFILVSSKDDATLIIKVDLDFLIHKSAKSSSSVPSSIWDTSVVVVFLEVFEPDDDGKVIVVGEEEGVVTGGVTGTVTGVVTGGVTGTVTGVVTGGVGLARAARAAL